MHTSHQTTNSPKTTKSVQTQIYIKQNIHKHQTQNFWGISPFGMAPVKKAHMARAHWYCGPFCRCINPRFFLSIKKKWTEAIKHWKTKVTHLYASRSKTIQTQTTTSQCLMIRVEAQKPKGSIVAHYTIPQPKARLTSHHCWPWPLQQPMQQQWQWLQCWARCPSQMTSQGRQWMMTSWKRRQTTAQTAAAVRPGAAWWQLEAAVLAWRSGS